MGGNTTLPPNPAAPTGPFDWRATRGACTGTITILNQGQCGSCYAHSAVTAIQHRACTVSGPSFGILAPQAVLSCTSTESTGAFTCNGGNPSSVATWIAANGVTNTCCSPYNQANGGNIIGTCPLTTGACSVPLTSSGGTSGGVVSTSTSSTSQFLGCSAPPAAGAA